MDNNLNNNSGNNGNNDRNNNNNPKRQNVFLLLTTRQNCFPSLHLMKMDITSATNVINILQQMN